MTLLSSIHSPADLRKLSVEQLPLLAQEIRAAICDQVGKSGGHLAPNLGVVELTIALHYVFDFGPDGDRLLFDVGHQCYPHKLLTGRLPLLAGLRTSAGMSGFPEPNESGHDLFRVGHAGTAISCGVGMARGDTLSGQGYDPEKHAKGRRVACVIGDASIVNGVAMEGLNGAGTLKRQFLVILNDNGMSISKPQGALAQYFDRVRVSHLYSDLKKRGKGLLKDLPGGSLIREAYHKASEAAKAVRHDGVVAGGGAGGGWFEHFGLVTVGPIDGHDLPTLIEFFTEARDFDRPMVLHVKTIKGKGYDFAEGDASTFHSPAPFVREGCRVELKKDGRSFTAAVGEALADLMTRDEKIVVATAAMPDGTGVSKVLPLFPDRTFDTGICESHAMDMMAGLAKTGFKPFFAVYATFLQRAFDQAFQESSLQGLPVRLLLDRAGLVGGDGSVHHGFCDISLLRVLPGAAITAAIDEPSMLAALEFMRNYDTGLSSLRYPRDNVSSVVTAKLGATCPSFVLGKARCLTPEFEVCRLSEPASAHTPDVAILAFGTPAIDAIRAAAELRGEYRVAIYDARFAKPVDHSLIRDLLTREIPIVTVEDHGLIGGFGAAVLESAQQQNLDASRIIRLGLPDSWIMQDSRASQLAEAGIDAAGIARGIRAAAELAAVDRMLEQPSVQVALRVKEPAR